MAINRNNLDQETIDKLEDKMERALKAVADAKNSKFWDKYQRNALSVYKELVSAGIRDKLKKKYMTGRGHYGRNK